MPEIFLISDTHFGHEKILEFVEGRRVLGKTIEEHDEALVERWNKVIRPKDTVWHLGDVAFKSERLSIVGRLNGRKKLVKGNHDVYHVNRYLEYFVDVKGAVSLEGFLLTHVPIHSSQKFRFLGNIHGHLHDKLIYDPFYFNVSCERVNYQPIPLHIVRQHFEKEQS